MMTTEKTIFNEINFYQPKEYPSEPIEFHTFRSNDKVSEDVNREFYKQQFVQDYLETKWEHELYNRDAFLRLYEIFAHCDPDDKDALCQKLAQFKRKIMENHRPYQALRIDFSKYPFDDKPKVWEE